MSQVGNLHITQGTLVNIQKPSNLFGVPYFETEQYRKGKAMAMAKPKEHDLHVW